MRIVAIFPGRYHPFHKGHASSFKQLAKKFGLSNTLLAISAKQEQPDSPFAAQDRAKMAEALGIPARNIITVRNPYNAMEYATYLESNGYDPTKTALVFGVSNKDMGDEPRFSFKPKKDGTPSYFQPFTRKALTNLHPMTKGSPGSGHAYVLTLPVQDFPIAGKTMRDASAIRKAYAGKNDKIKMKILTDLYGDKANNMKQTFDNNLQVTESIKRLIQKIKPLLKEANASQKVRLINLIGMANRKLNETKQVNPHEPFDLGQSHDISTLDPEIMRKHDNSETYANRSFNQVWPDEEQKHAGRLENLEEANPKSYKEGWDFDMVKDLGNGFVLGKTTDDFDPEVTKQGYAVYKLDRGNVYTLVDHLNISPYPQNRRPGAIQAEIDRIMSSVTTSVGK